jgi:putative tryptophan/tyrosine transport system substrate-binding protein
MRRREFIALLGGSAAAWPLAARAQQPERVRRVGVLMPLPPGDAEAQARVRAFREELRKRGWASGVNVQFDERWTIDNMDLIRSAAANLVELKPDVILAVGGRVIPVLMQMTRSVPIVIPGGIDPVGRGWAESMARPGGNITGFTVMELSIIGKMLQTLKEVAPNVARVAIVCNPDNPEAAVVARSFQAAAETLFAEPIVSYVHGLADIERAVANVAAQPNGGIFFPLDLTVSAFMEQTIALVAQHRLPAVYADSSAVGRGGLMFYGADRIEIFRRAASYIDRILRGEKPGDLPYQQPTKYDLVINRKTANAIGLEVPPKLLFTADEVIE